MREPGHKSCPHFTKEETEVQRESDSVQVHMPIAFYQLFSRPLIHSLGAQLGLGEGLEESSGRLRSCVCCILSCDTFHSAAWFKNSIQLSNMSGPVLFCSKGWGCSVYQYGENKRISTLLCPLILRSTVLCYFASSDFALEFTILYANDFFSLEY